VPKPRHRVKQITGRIDNHVEQGPGETGRQHPLADDLTKQFSLDTPGVGQALVHIHHMRRWGVKITAEVAAACIKHHIEMQERLDRVMAARPNQNHDPVVYYMLLGNRVKIGTTTNMAKRKQSIGAEAVLAFEPGDAALERERHDQFADLRTHAEWFRYESPLVEWIEQVRERHGEAIPRSD